MRDLEDEARIKAYMEAKMKHKTEVTPAGWVKIDEVRKYFDSVGCGTIYKTAGEDRVPLYLAPPKREWVGLTDEEVKYLTSHFDWRAPKEQFVPVIEAKLKEKNSGN